MTTQREFITKIIECFPLDEDGTGHVVDCGYTEAHERCGCAAVPGKLASLLAAHDREVAAKALRDAENTLREMARPWGDDQMWITTGTKVATVAGDVIKEMIEDAS